MLKYLSQVGQARRGLGHRHPMTERDVIKYEKAVRKGQEMTDEEARKGKAGTREVLGIDEKRLLGPLHCSRVSAARACPKLLPQSHTHRVFVPSL